LKLSQATKINSMIDLSDGLGIDASHIAAQSRVGIVLWHDRIPCTVGSHYLEAISSGEDYELLFTTAADQTVPPEMDGVRVTKIGFVEEGRGTVGLDTGDAVIDLSSMGWQHEG
jgi:thiamine-monophosphate kinase